MTVTIDQAYVNAYSDNVHTLVEQKESKLRPLVTLSKEQVEKVFFDRFGTLSVADITGRWQDSLIQDGAYSRRMITNVKKGCAVSLSDLDTLKMMMDPTSYITTEMARAHGREFDDVVIAAILGTAAIGQTGSSTQSFDSNMQVAHGSAGFTVAKFNTGLKLLEANEVDVDRAEMYLLAGAAAIEDLMADALFTSFDYQNGKVLSTGKLPQFRGVNIIRTQRIPAQTASSVYRCLLLTGDCMRANIAKDIQVSADVIPTKNNEVLIQAFMTYGAVRMEEKLVADILFQ
jgi:hypothetical protein